MDIAGYMNSIVSFAHTNTLLAAVGALFLLFFLYRKPKLFFTLVFLGLFLAGTFHMITKMARSGSEQKQKMVTGEDKLSP